MLRKTFSLALLALFLLVPVLGTAFAQTGTIEGTVVDSLSSETLPGVNVVVEELGQGDATDSDGTFRIDDLPADSYTLRISFVGYREKTVPVEVEAGETTTLEVELVSSEVQLEDVVVTALGVEREQESVGSSIQQVEGQDLDQAGESNFVSSLTGRVSGAQIQNSNAMGGSSRITLRGPGSLSGSGQPLVVVDGVPIDNSNFNDLGQNTGSGGYDYGNAASMINPSDIESVSVLKGASAAALYGSRAADGVIEITTKSGRDEGGIGVNVQTGVEISDLYGFPDYQNKYGGGASPNFSENDEGQLVADYGTDQSWGPRLDGRQVREWHSYDDVSGAPVGETSSWDAHPNNVENFYNTGATWNTNVAFSQSDEDYNYRLSLKNEMQRGNSVESDMEQRNLGFNGSLNLTENLTASASANYVDEEARGRPGSGYTNANGPWLQFNHFGQRQVDLSDDAPMRDIVRPDGTQRSWNWANSTTAPETGDIIYANNPFWIRERNYQNDDSDRLYGKVELSYDLMDNLTVTADARTDYYTTRQEERIAIGSVEQSQYEEDVREVQESHVGGTIDYTGQLTETVSVEALGGVDYRYNSLSRNQGVTQGGLSTRGVFTLENSVSRPSLDDYFQEQALIGAYGDVTFGYEDLAYVGGTLRNDWASTLPEDNNSYLYPSVNGSFVFSNLAALSESDLLSYGKIRLNWSQVGRDTDPYRLSFTYPIQSSFRGTIGQALPSSVPNFNLEPEIKSEWEIGTELQFFENRLGLDATYYSAEIENQIIQVEGSRASGYESRVLNAGTIANKGVELSLNATAAETESFSWDWTVNWSKNVEEVVSLAEGVSRVPLNNAASAPPFGPSLTASEGGEFGVFYGPGFARTDEGDKIVSGNGFYQDTGSQELGSYLPDWQGGVSTTLSYEGFRASILVDGQKGGNIWSLSNLFGLYSGMFSESAANNIRQLGARPDAVLEDGSPFYGVGGTEDNPTTAAGNASAKNVLQLLFGNHEAHLYDASYIKLREVTLSYSLPQQWFSGTQVQNMTASLYGRNLATLLKYTPNFDPTAVVRGSSNLQGIEAGQMPPRRTIGFRLSLNF
ncbi:MAG: SusC/RagA family TonB-linked outer membrane protein [Salinivenus sp.]